MTPAQDPIDPSLRMLTGLPVPDEEPLDDGMWEGGDSTGGWTSGPRAVAAFPPPPRAARTMRTRDDIGNAQRLIDRYGPIVRWVLIVKGGEWAVYDGRRWAFRGGDTLVRTLTRLTVEDLPKTEALSYSAENPVDEKGKKLPSDRDVFLAYVSKLRDHRVMGRAISAASSFPELHAQPEDFDANRRWLNLPNGILDTDKVLLKPHNPDLMLSRMFGVPYNERAQAAVWERFLTMNIPDENTRLYLQKAAGYTLSGLSNEKTLLYLYGPSDTGKSIFTGVMSRLFGEYGLVASDGALRPRREGTVNNDVDGMAGKRFVTTSESRPGEEMDEALVKRLTGRDEQTTRALYQNNRTWTPECVIWVCSNQYPKITGDDDAIWTRIRVVPFLRQFLAGDPNRDERLEEKLHAEMEGIFAWAVRGLRMYLRDGLMPPPEVLHAGEAFRTTADGVTAFVAEYTEDGFLTIEESAWAPRTELYEMYKRWCKESAMREPLRPSRFYARLDVSYRAAKVNGTRGYAGITTGPKKLAPEAWSR
ncbi:phage/plasmid primase, P4 family [Streptomyces sp. NPDC001027]|uniref:DNA primase family protein n=1 Tax=Streptomyces sp. NPDC001027 TaxID=3154771 RepID=UPI00331C36A6